ncbi:MAG: hypothetical protein ACPW60_09900 [Methylohalobius sp. ZOD2]
MMNTKAMAISLLLSMGLSQGVQADLLGQLTGGGSAFPDLGGGDGEDEGISSDLEQAISEIEPNDTPQDATALTPGELHLGTFDSNSDLDWYQFQAIQAGATATIEIPAQGGGWRLTLQDRSGQVLARFPNEEDADRRFQVVLPQIGDFFLVAEPLQDAADYFFSVSGEGIVLPGTGTPDEAPVTSRRDEFLAKAQREKEPNNHIAAANPVDPGQPVSGQLFSLEDEDWYALRATQADTIVNVEMPAGPAQWQIALLDEAGNLLDARVSSTENELLYSTLLEKAGKFYLVVSGVEDSDSRDNYTFNVTGEGLENPEDRNLNANFHDAEIEFNDTLEEANSLTSAVRLVGQLRNSSDVDLYRLESPGDEILSIELCPGNAVCGDQFTEGSGPWVIYVFDGDRVTQSMLDAEVPLTVCSGDQPTQVFTNHMYLSLNVGLFDHALLGIIDPAFGVSRRVEVGLKDPGAYFLAVSSPLRRDEDGSVILKEEGTCGKDEEGNDVKIEEQKIIIEPFSDDQYEMQVVQTSLTPSITLDTITQTALREDNVSDVMHVPVVEVNGVEYSADLLRLEQNGEVMFELLNAEPIGTATAATDVESLKREAMRATLNGDNVHIPLAQLDGHYYSGDLRLIRDNDRMLFEVIQFKRLD